MSAIAGLYCLNGRHVGCGELERMVQSLAHRGSDGQGVWRQGPVGLGHRMLWTTPESCQETLPLVHRKGDLALTADARLDNREELLTALGMSGGRSHAVTDSALILAAYEAWGEHCPEHLVGDFAFALWDGRQQVLFCARDHFGVRPFYYSYRAGQCFAFATEIKALLCLPEVPRRLNEVRIADYLDAAMLMVDTASTFYQDIVRLPAGHSITVGSAAMSGHRYWSLDPMRELRYGSDAEYAEAFRALFIRGVQDRLRSAFPVGAMLSGGLDSSAIVCVARHLRAQDEAPQVHTFSAVFDDLPACDERPFINAVLRQGNLIPHSLHADRLSPLADIDLVLWHEDEPFYTPNLFMHWGLYRAAQQQGMRVMLDGFDGDTTVSHGLGLLQELWRTGRWLTLAHEVRGLAQHFHTSPWSIVWRHAMRPVVASHWSAWRSVRGQRWQTQRVDPIINPTFARRLRVAERAQALTGDRTTPPRTSRDLHYRGMTSGIIPFALEVADKAAAACALQPCYPFFDKRLAEFCLALPPTQKLHQGWTRLVMRRAMADILPTEVQWRGSKSNLSPNFLHGLRTLARECLEEVILNPPEMIREYVDMAVLHDAFHQSMDQGVAQAALTVWKVATLALWLRSASVSH